MARTTKTNLIDVYDASQVARAAYYTACFLIGRGKRRTVKCETLEEARATAVALNAEFGGFGRRAMLYAVTPEGASFPVS